ncbi:unnamed protein product [Urochloa decumbens]|uniref:Uncharacterized protein n=1 Tax=Urochloa decumbens TaxID=240449 RepID=A0ABC8ZZU4_9POAL
MAARLLLLQLSAGVAASCLYILAAGCPADAPPRMPPSNGGVVPAVTAAVAPAPHDGVPTPAAPDAGVAVGSSFRGARRLAGLGPPRHILLSDAPAPSGRAHAAGGRTSLLAIFSPVLFILGCSLFVAGLLKSADLCAAAKARRHKAKRVRPLGQDAIDAAAAP